MNGTPLVLGVTGGLAVAALFRKQGARNAAATAWWHGTDAKHLPSILEEGLRGQPTQGRKMLDPIRGRVYAARELRHALPYAIGNDVAGVDLTRIPAAARKRFEGEGAILRLRPAPGTHVLPDEDWVGELVTERLDVDNTCRELTEHSTPRSQAWAARALTLLPTRTRASIDRIPVVRLDDITTQAKVGKQVIAALQRTPEGRAHLADAATYAATVSFDGPIVIEGAWTFNRLRDCAGLGKNGETAFEVMRPVAREAS